MAMAPAGLPQDARDALSDAIASVIQNKGSKSNAFINRVFSLKVATGADERAYVTNTCLTRRP
ncbi:hypothetical protein [Antarctobacter jejuensis]|uniref:hypothetical protein n=1 Tax=Antarctobacter jejuensis TaxID=1439938 RepID=UPI003FD34F9D